MTEQAFLAFVGISDGWMYPGVTGQQEKALRRILEGHTDEQLAVVAGHLVESRVQGFDFKEVARLLKGLKTKAVKATSKRCFWWTNQPFDGWDVCPDWDEAPDTVKLARMAYISEWDANAQRQRAKAQASLTGSASPV